MNTSRRSNHRNSTPRGVHVVLCAVLVACLIGFALPAMAIRADIDLPDAWGADRPAKKPAGSGLSASEPAGYLLMPTARITVGNGQVDPADYLDDRRAGSAYVLDAPAGGILEFLVPVGERFDPGQALARLYDPGILPDLQEAQEAARRWRDRPYTVLGPSRPDFPSPTAARRTPLAPQPPEPTPPVEATSQGGLQQRPNAGGIARAQEPAAAPQQAEPAVDLQKLEAESDDAHADVGELKVQLKNTEDEISALVPRLQQAEDDLKARQRLFEKGIVARNTVEVAREELKALTGRMDDLRDRRGTLQASLAEAADRLDAVQKQISQVGQTGDSAPGPPQRHINETPQQPDEPRAVSAPSPRAQLSTTRPSHDADTSPREQEYPEPMVMPEHDAHAGVEAEAETPESAPEPQQVADGIPRVFTHLNAPEWETISAPSQGVVLERLVADGEQVSEGADLLSIANTEWARVYAEVAPEALKDFQEGAPVTITFQKYPRVRFDGWIEHIEPSDDRDQARVEMYVVCTAGYHADDAYSTISWLAHATSLEAQAGVPMEPNTTTEARHAAAYSAWELFPLAPSKYSPTAEKGTVSVPGQYVGHIEAAQLSPDDTVPTSEDAKARLKQLAQWRESFTDDMTTTVFDNRLVLTYPATGPANSAIEKMVTGRVSHVRNRCARTMAEAVGFGLGDAADWATRLPARGWMEREDGVARPGDILVWPFTYGPGNTQHIGIAVLQSGRLMLLSNLAGRLGTTDVLPGYRAFHRPGATECALGGSSDDTS